MRVSSHGCISVNLYMAINKRVTIVAYDDDALSITIYIDTKRYEYALGDAYHAARDKLRSLRRAPGRQLNWLKRRGALINVDGSIRN